MDTPNYSGNVLPETVAAAQAAGLPMVNGQQAVGHVCYCPPGGADVHWYKLADGSEVVVNDDDNPAVWP